MLDRAHQVVAEEADRPAGEGQRRGRRGHPHRVHDVLDGAERVAGVQRAPRPVGGGQHQLAARAPDDGLRAHADHRVAPQAPVLDRLQQEGRTAVAQLEEGADRRLAVGDVAVHEAAPDRGGPPSRAPRPGTGATSSAAAAAAGRLQAQPGHAGLRREASSAATSSRLDARSPARARRGGTAGRRSRRPPGRARGPWRRSRPRSPPPPPSCRRCRCPWPAAGPCTTLSGSAASARSPTVRTRSESAAKGSRRRRRQGVVEAGRRAGVTRDTGLVHLHQNRIAVAIQGHRPHRLGVAAGRALVPQLAARAAPEPGLPALEGALQRVAVHVRQGQHAAAAGVLHHGRDQPLVVEAGPLHQRGGRLLTGPRHQAVPLSWASSASTLSALGVLTRAAPAPIIACTVSSVRISPGGGHADALRQRVAHQLHVVDGGRRARRRCRSWRSRRPSPPRSCRRAS